MCITKFTAYSIKSQLKNYFIYYYIATFLPHDNFFDILLVFVFFSSDILWYLFFLYSILFFSSSDKFLYLSLACPLNLFLLFHNNSLLYFVSRLCFFDNKLIQRSCIYSFLIYNLQIFIKHPFYQPN